MERTYMSEEQRLGMVLGYFLSRMDHRAYNLLGFGTQKETHQALGKLLRVRPNSIKNWRDEFDPVHPNARKGWHKRDMLPSRLRVIEALSAMPDDDLIVLIQAIVNNPKGYIAAHVASLVAESPQDMEARPAVNRAQTGARAEELFLVFHRQTSRPLAGRLRDCRLEMCGFDFEISAPEEQLAVEVKGMASDRDRMGLTFTNLEWSVAKQMSERYILAAIRDVHDTPEITLIRDPVANIDAALHIVETPRLTWRANTDLADELFEVMDV